MTEQQRVRSTRTLLNLFPTDTHSPHYLHEQPPLTYRASAFDDYEVVY